MLLSLIVLLLLVFHHYLNFLAVLELRLNNLNCGLYWHGFNDFNIISLLLSFILFLLLLFPQFLHIFGCIRTDSFCLFSLLRCDRCGFKNVTFLYILDIHSVIELMYRVLLYLSALFLFLFFITNVNRLIVNLPLLII